MKEEQQSLEALHNRILTGQALPGDKETLAHWMAGMDIQRDAITPEALAAEQQRSQTELRVRLLQPIPERREYRLPAIKLWIAAACITAVVLSMYLLLPTRYSVPALAVAYAESSTQAGQQKVIVLADGSRIRINGASHIKYPAAATAQREVYLQGQAFFEVSADKTHPFIVHAGPLTVQVLGTSFDISSYKEDAQASVAVTQGKIAVQTAHNPQPYALEAGHQLVLNQLTGSVREQVLDTADYPAWQQGIIVFKEETLHNICTRLQRAYGVKITVQTSGLEKTKLNLTVRGEAIAKVVDMLSAAGSFRYNIRNKEITLWKN
jgi:ferric-dicitrate binding protein FerR (iron transport regulator)